MDLIESAVLREQLAAKENEVRRLRNAVKQLALLNPVEGVDVASESSEEDDDSEGDIPTALWDEGDCVYRCLHCTGEIEGGACFLCLREHITPDENVHDSLPADNQAFSDDRASKPRGTTPLLERPKFGVVTPLSYANRSEEYANLIRRGATRAMCEQFNLEFTQNGGIYAWANQDILDEFMTSIAKEGDQWKIYLGRRIELDEEDLDGTQFIEGILEDGVLFCRREGRGIQPRWVTVKDGKTTWVTRPNPDMKDPLFLGEDAFQVDEQRQWYFGTRDANGTFHESEEQYSDSDSEEEAGPNQQLTSVHLDNEYDTEDDAEEQNTPEENVDICLPLDPTLYLGIFIGDSMEEDMDWEEDSAGCDMSSCDSDFDAEESD
ncbi:hypothetical protein DFP72DRAFT_875412 [Ephemerocybe angulata]|uniref:DUF8191 domain-containing protein n=1 Tax=Ephemerocybe angulata TaxID=980116 RepID=A0A8H6MFI1_9AGAR|nr:hypothetical protein DFP72DRAFT_875412 [Tulosesus angulatus]